MFEKIKGISLRGHCFAEECTLDFFPNPQKNRLALVYGKNGSGKTTCAKGFCLCANPHAPINDLTAQLHDIDSPEGKIPTPENGWGNIHVFDEDYVINNLRIDDDGLGSIVLLGEQVDIDNQLKDLEKRHSEYEKKLVPIQKKAEQFLDSTFEEAPIHIKNEIFEKLRGPGGWAEIDRSIRGNRVNSRVDDALFEDLRTMQVVETLEALQTEFNEKKSLYDRSADNEQKYPTAILPEPVFVGIDEKIRKALARVLEKPELTERDQKIFNILIAPNNHKDEIVEIFSNSATCVCPYCFQDISQEYKTSLLSRIANIFNREADQFKNDIKLLRISNISRDFTSFKNLDADLVLQMQKNVNDCNTIIGQYNKLLDQKYSNVFAPIAIESLELETLTEQLNIQINKLENKRQEFMRTVRERDAVKKSLILLNKKITKKSTERDFSSYENSVAKQNDTQKQLSALNTELSNIDTEVVKLKQKKENIFVAIGQINRDLEYVFFSKNRIVLEPMNTSYVLKVNGKSVRPKDVSCGERNAIALCYFFTESFQKKNFANAYAEESLFVIDDPVSSFDIGNRVGINSYLKYKIQSIVYGNKNSKVLVFSHDIVTTWDLEKAFHEICNSNSSLSYVPKEIKDFSLIDFCSKKRNEYSSLMERTYDYAVNKTGDPQSIGNIIRRMLEAFSTFIYRMGIEDLSCAPEICSLFKQRSTFFNSLMYRLVLHGESHAEEAARANVNEMLCFCYATDDEKQKMARYIIAMIYCLQREHTLIHLKNAGKDVQQNIKKWLAEIPLNAENIPEIREETAE